MFSWHCDRPSTITTANKYNPHTNILNTNKIPIEITANIGTHREYPIFYAANSLAILSVSRVTRFSILSIEALHCLYIMVAIL